MNQYIFYDIVLVTMNISLYLLNSVKYRIEDAERKADGSLKIKSFNQKYTPWIMCVFTTATLVAPVFDDPDIRHALIGVPFLILLVANILSACNYQSYYTFDDDRLTHIKNGKVKWSYEWNEIESATKYYGGMDHSSQPTYYDIVTRDGVKHRFLPPIFGEDLDNHILNVRTRLWSPIDTILLLVFVIMFLVMYIIFLA